VNTSLQRYCTPRPPPRQQRNPVERSAKWLSKDTSQVRRFLGQVSTATPELGTRLPAQGANPSHLARRAQVGSSLTRRSTRSNGTWGAWPRQAPAARKPMKGGDNMPRRYSSSQLRARMRMRQQRLKSELRKLDAELRRAQRRRRDALRRLESDLRRLRLRMR